MNRLVNRDKTDDELMAIAEQNRWRRQQRKLAKKEQAQRQILLRESEPRRPPGRVAKGHSLATPKAHQTQLLHLRRKSLKKRGFRVNGNIQTRRRAALTRPCRSNR